MTLPNLIGNYHKKQTVTHLKKFYSTMQQAVRSSEVDNGAVQYWNFGIGGNSNTKLFVDKYLRPYVKIIKEYTPAEFPADINYTCTDGGNCNSYGEIKSNNPKIVLADGTMIISADLAAGYRDDGSTVYVINFIVDINGFKKPNKFGRDVFAFTLQDDKGFIPAGMGYTSTMTGSNSLDRTWFTTGGNGRGCTTTQDGFYCAALIMSDNWEMKEDYPW